MHAIFNQRGLTGVLSFVTVPTQHYLALIHIYVQVYVLLGLNSMSFILLYVSAYKAIIRQIQVNSHLQTIDLCLYMNSYTSITICRISDIPFGMDFSCFEIN
jgi:hypothetical protein